MSALQAIDAAVFRFINGTLSNAFFDWLMPILAGGEWFLPIVLALAALWVWRGGKRARLCAVMLAIVVPVGDGWITNTLKDVVARPRPCRTLERVNLPMREENPKPDEENVFRTAGCSDRGSMPSGHTTNWFCATAVAWIFYRRSWRFMLPMAALVGFSRIYNGVHYPGDVLAGAIIGAGYGLALSIGVNVLWRNLVAPFFPRWCASVPSLLPGAATLPEQRGALPSADVHWLRLGLLLILAVLGVRLWLAGSDRTDLGADEAFRWLWARQLQFGGWLSAPLAVWGQWLASKAFGPHEFAVRFFAPIGHALVSYVALRCFKANVSGRAGFWLVAILQVTPLLTAGPSLLGVDALLAFFGALACFAAWQVTRPEATTKDWAWLGLGLGLCYWSNPGSSVLVACLLLWRPFRQQLRKPGLYVALLFWGVCLAFDSFVPGRNGLLGNWAGTIDLGPTWRTRFETPREFLGLALVLLNPIFIIAAAWAAIANWRSAKDGPLPRLFLAFCLPLAPGFALVFLPAQLRLNWIAMAAVPAFCLLVVFWQEHLACRPRLVGAALAVGLALGAAGTALLHESGLTKSLTGARLPAKLDPLQRVRGWSAMGRAVSRERNRLAEEGKPAFVIGDNAGTTALLTFHMSQARTNRMPLVYCRSDLATSPPLRSWPDYPGPRAGQNAVYVQDAESPDSPPALLARQFASVTNAGTILIHHRGRPLRNMRLFICRDLQP